MFVKSSCFFLLFGFRSKPLPFRVIVHACANSFESTPSLPWVFSSIFAQEETPMFHFIHSCCWSCYHLEEESLFRLHPVVSGPFHWEQNNKRHNHYSLRFNKPPKTSHSPNLYAFLLDLVFQRTIEQRKGLDSANNLRTHGIIEKISNSGTVEIFYSFASLWWDPQQMDELMQSFILLSRGGKKLSRDGQNSCQQK